MATPSSVQPEPRGEWSRDPPGFSVKGTRWTSLEVRVRGWGNVAGGGTSEGDRPWESYLSLDRWGNPIEGSEKELPRKEVIQPHLPVRLPCYDFVPIAGSALDGSLPCGLGHRLQAYPTFMT